MTLRLLVKTRIPAANRGFTKKQVQCLLNILPLMNFCAMLTVLSSEIHPNTKPDNFSSNFDAQPIDTLIYT